MKMTYFVLIKIKDPVQISPFQEFLLTPPESLVFTFLVFPSVLWSMSRVLPHWEDLYPGLWRGHHGLPWTRVYCVPDPTPNISPPFSFLLLIPGRKQHAPSTHVPGKERAKGEEEGVGVGKRGGESGERERENEGGWERGFFVQEHTWQTAEPGFKLFQPQSQVLVDHLVYGLRYGCSFLIFTQAIVQKVVLKK